MGRAVVVGMGFIGSEVAASLRGLGLDVVAVEPFAVPLERVLGPEVGRVIDGIHREHGVVAPATARGWTAFEGAGTGRARRDVVGRAGSSATSRSSASGIEPAVDVVAGTGVEVENGIVVDELCRTTVEGICAAGDVARHQHPLFGLVRVEHWRNAIEQGAAAARSMLGKGVPYAEVHWFWSDQYDANIQYTGHHTGWDELVVRGKPRRAEVRRLLHRRRASSVRRRREHRAATCDARQALISARSRRSIRRRCATPTIDLRTLVPGE